MAGLAAIASIAGTAVSVIGGIQQGKAAEDAAKFEAEQLKRRAAEERASGQRAAFEKQKEEDLIISKQRSIAAASGGGTDDPSILDLIEDTSRRGTFLQQSEIAIGESRARGNIDQANAAIFRGKQKKAASIIDAVGAGFSGLSKAFG
jgi:hypothetical protein